MKESFLIYKSLYGPLKTLSLEEKGLLFEAIFTYQIEGVVPDLPPVINMAFQFVKDQFDRDDNKYNEICERNHRNGSKGGRPGDETNNPENPAKPSQTQQTQLTQPNPILILKLNLKMIKKRLRLLRFFILAILEQKDLLVLNMKILRNKTEIINTK